MDATVFASPARPTSPAHLAKVEITSTLKVHGVISVHLTVRHAAAILCAPNVTAITSSMAQIAKAVALHAVVVKIMLDALPALLAHIYRVTSARIAYRGALFAQVR